jgi:predicted Zn-dependent peptidase
VYELTTLANGLRVLTVSMPHVQSVSLGFFLGVGSRYECERLAGASHFVEHVVFKGTARCPTALAIAEAIEGKGGMVNAQTGRETTLYWAKVAAPHLAEALDVLAGMLLCPLFDPAELEKERDVIGEEISYALDAPDSLVEILANEIQWPDHPVGRDVAGTRASVAALTRDELLAFLEQHYYPNQTVLGLAGHLTHAEGVAWAEAYLGGWQPGPALAYEPAPARQPGGQMRIEFKQTEQVHLNLILGGLSRSDPDRYALRLLNVILGDGMRSRLFQEVRERLGLAYSIDSYVTELHDTGAIGVYAGVGTNRVQAALQAILGQLDRFRQEAVSEDELHRTVEFVRGRLALSLEDSFAIAGWYARQELSEREVLDPEEVVARFESVRPADIQRLAQALFRTDRLNLAVVGPLNGNTDRFRKALAL